MPSALSFVITKVATSKLKGRYNIRGRFQYFLLRSMSGRAPLLIHEVRTISICICFLTCLKLGQICVYPSAYFLICVTFDTGLRSARVSDELSELRRVVFFFGDVLGRSFFLILAPLEESLERLRSYGSWKSRGWCQFEAAVNGLNGAKPVLHVDQNAIWHVNLSSLECV